MGTTVEWRGQGQWNPRVITLDRNCVYSGRGWRRTGRSVHRIHIQSSIATTIKRIRQLLRIKSFHPHLVQEQQLFRENFSTAATISVFSWEYVKFYSVGIRNGSSVELSWSIKCTAQVEKGLAFIICIGNSRT